MPKKMLVSKLMAEVLANKIDLGQYSMDECIAIGRAILNESSVDLLGMKPSSNAVRR